MAINSGQITPDEEKAILLNKLLNHGYPFGDTTNGDRFFWDLTSYNEVDQSYDIYWIPDENAIHITYIGRDFFEFISEFCLGQKSSKLLPKDYTLNILENQEKIFIGFQKQDIPNHNQEAQLEKILKMNEESWENWVRMGLTENTEISLTGSYHASNKDRAELLKNDLENQIECEIKIISGGESRNIYSLVEVGISERTITQTLFYEILNLMVAIGKKYNCLFMGLGANFNPKSYP